MFVVSPRIRAFLWHLFASALLGLLALALVFFAWHPAPLHKATGVTGIFLLLLGVHVILGPGLTLAIAKPGKKKILLFMDLVIIITVQLSALLYGLHTIAERRPVWLVLSTDRFNTVCVGDIAPEGASRAPLEYRHPSWGRPQWAFTPLPEDVETRNAILNASLGGVEIYHQPEYYRPIEEGRAQIQEKAKPLAELGKFNAAKDIQEKLTPYPEADAWMPLRSEVLDMVVLVKKEEGRVVAIIDLRPWEM